MRQYNLILNNLRGSNKEGGTLEQILEYVKEPSLELGPFDI